jgi:hypothetical protein
MVSMFVRKKQSICFDKCTRSPGRLLPEFVVHRIPIAESLKTEGGLQWKDLVKKWDEVLSHRPDVSGSL